MAPSEDRVAGATEEFCLKRTENAGKTCSRDFNQNFSLNDVVPKGICCTLSTYNMHLSLLGILNSQRRSICSLYSPYFIITLKKKEEDLRQACFCIIPTHNMDVLVLNRTTSAWAVWVVSSNSQGCSQNVGEQCQVWWTFSDADPVHFTCASV